MMPDIPRTVHLVEVGPRDGFQSEDRIVPTDLKIEMIRSLADAGIREIQATAFVNPEVVPQMGDAEDLIRRLVSEIPTVDVTALVLNPRGLDRAAAAGLQHVEISISASETHGRKNAGMGLNEARAAGVDMVRDAKSRGFHVRSGIQCVFGCVYDGAIPLSRVADIAADFKAAGADVIAIADTTGMAHPLSVSRCLQTLTPIAGDIPLAMHFHDTRGLGLVNLMTALQQGVTIFDSAFGGMGGCPFVRGAAGNIATEDAAYLMDVLGVRTGVNIERVSTVSRRAERFFNKRYPGHHHHILPSVDDTGDCRPVRST